MNKDICDLGLIKGVVFTSPNRDDVLATLAYFIEMAGNKVASCRAPRDYDIEKNRREWVRTGIYACAVCLSGLKTKEEEQIEERITSLEISLQEVTA